MKITNKRRKEIERELQVIGSVASEDSKSSVVQEPVEVLPPLKSKAVLIPLVAFVLVLLLFFI